jgi:hypothetical protein
MAFGAGGVYATAVRKDVVYDVALGQAALPIEVHLGDGAVVPSVLWLKPGEVEMALHQLGRAVELREAERSCG